MFLVLLLGNFLLQDFRGKDFVDHGEIIKGGVFLRVAIDVDWFLLQQSRQTELSTYQYHYPCQLECYEQIIGENNIMTHLPNVLDIAASLKAQCSRFRRGAVLTGGDASGTRAHTESKCAHCFVVFGVGESSPTWWEKRSANDVRVIACGGSIDWIDPLQQSSGRSEVLCILTVLLRFRGLGINILHSAGYLYARTAVMTVQGWRATQWCSCTNRDLWESIAYLLNEYKAAGTRFQIFHNRAHRENWQNEIENYTALEAVAHMPT